MKSIRNGGEQMAKKSKGKRVSIDLTNYVMDVVLRTFLFLFFAYFHGIFISKSISLFGIYVFLSAMLFTIDMILILKTYGGEQ